MPFGQQLKVRNALAQRDDVLFSKFKHFEQQAKQLLEYAQGGSHLSFTTHGLSHVTRVEQIYDWLLSDDDVADFTPSELFCLLCATLSHDVFMIPRQLGDESRSRAEHATHATRELRKHKERLGLLTSEATYIGQIIEGHHVEEIKQLPEQVVLGQHKVRIQMLGACLSMADICHADESRAPEIVFGYLTLDEESARHWKRHMQIAGINRADSKILISAITFSDDGKKAVSDYADEIQKQLHRVHPYFRSQLQAVDGIELQIQELESEFEQDLSFKTDASAVFNMLVSGVYQQSDVFVRELIQNALDAGYVEGARSKKNGIPYSARISVLELKDPSGKVSAIRIDDNGSGMDIAEAKDTLLWIGQSRNSKDSVQTLLQETGKSLIANFGIGLLSCFRVSKNIVIRTQKSGSRRPFELNISGYGERVRISQIDEDANGTTVFVHLSDEFADLKTHDIFRHYCRMVTQADLYYHSTTKEQEFYRSREHLWPMVATSGLKIEPVDLGSGSVGIEGRGYYCRLTVPWEKEPRDIIATTGRLTVLNDGILVCEDDAEEWLPASLSFCTGLINFAAKQVDLPVARDAVVDNAKLDAKRDDLAERCYSLLGRFAKESASERRRNRIALLLSYAYARTAPGNKSKVLAEIGDLSLKLFDGALISLSNLASEPYRIVYVLSKEGTWVEELGEMDGVKLWHKKDGLAEMHAELAHKQGELVIEAARADGLAIGKIDRVREWDLISAYLKSKNVMAFDLLKDVPSLGIRALSLPRELRTIVGRRVKFVETGIQPDKIGWDRGGEVWLNVTNPVVSRIYEKVRNEAVTDKQELALSVLVSLVDNEFDAAISACVDAMS